MGWLRKLFGGETKESLIRGLAKQRLVGNAEAEAFGATPAAIDMLPLEMLAGLPEATIVSIVEAWSQGRSQQIPDGATFQFIEAHRSMAAEGEMPSSPTLGSYVKYRVNLEYAEVAPVSPAHIEHCIRVATKFFGQG